MGALTFRVVLDRDFCGVGVRGEAFRAGKFFFGGGGDLNTNGNKLEVFLLISSADGAENADFA